MKYTVRPITDWTPFGHGEHKSSPFTVSWSTAEELLDRELWYMDATNVVLELAVVEAQIRNDGMVRADAKIDSPAVRIAFDSNQGPLTFATDRFVKAYWRSKGMQRDWMHNVYAIAKGLEALRLVDRYEITQRAEQYTGFKALGGGTPLPAAPTMSRDDAAELLRSYGRVGDDLGECVRRARHATHPDMGHPREQWDRVELAARTLGLIR